VLNDNYRELAQLAQDAFEDALLMECDEEQIRRALHELVDSLRNPYREGSDPAWAGHEAVIDILIIFEA